MALVLYTILYVVSKGKITAAIVNNMFKLKMHETRRSQMDTALLQNDEHLETIVECVGPLYNQSCLYKNLYYVNSAFQIFIVKGRSLPNLTIRSHWMPPSDLSPKKREFNSYAQLERFVRSVVKPTVIPDLTVYLYELWTFNIAHALFDGLYPAYVSVIRFAPRHRHAFRLLTGFFGCKNCWIADVCSRFAGLGILDLDDLKNRSAKGWFVFDSLIMGNGNMCQRCATENLQLPGGVELDGSRLFRERMYEMYGVCPPIPRHKHSAENRNFRDLLIAYVIDNKRFTDDDRKEIQAAIDEINEYTDMHLHESVDKIIKLRRPLIRISYLNYSSVTGEDSNSLRVNRIGVDSTPLMYKRIENKFEAQLRLVRKMDIHVSGPGTGQMYQTFLPDGSVTINLGGVSVMKDANKTIKYAQFMEQYLAAGAPYMKGLYYPINERINGIKKKRVVELIEKAAQLIMDAFSIPVVPSDNLAPDGQLFTEMCEKDKDFCASFTDRRVDREVRCMDSWVEIFVHENHVWSVGGAIEQGKNVTCPFNRTLLHELRVKYGIDHQAI